MNPSIQCFNIQKDNQSDFYGCFILGPFPLGEGLTISNTLRRVLLSSLGGIVITSIKFKDPSIHEFSSLPGIRESILDILFNLSKISFYEKQKTDSCSEFFEGEGVLASLKINKTGKIFAKDIEIPNGLQICNSNQYIAEIIAESGFLEFDMMIEKGVGSGDPNQYYRFQNNGGCILPIDANFIPIKRINYRIEEYLNPIQNNEKVISSISIQKKERVIFEVWTTRNLHPKDVIQLGLREVLNIFSNLYQNNFQISSTPKNIFDEIQFRYSKNFFSFVEYKKFLRYLKFKYNYHKLNFFQKKEFSRQIINTLNNLSSLKLPKVTQAQVKTKSSKQKINSATSHYKNSQKIRIQLDYNKKINNTLLSNARIIKHLNNANLKSFEELIKLSRKDFLMIKNIGPRSIDVINFSLAHDFGYKIPISIYQSSLDQGIKD